MTPAPPRLRVTEIGEYIRHQSCERRFKLEINDRVLAKTLPFADRLFNTLDPVLQEIGAERENEWEASLKAAGLTDLTGHGGLPDDAKATDWSDFAKQLEALPVGQTAYGREITIEAPVGAFLLHGRIDFVLVFWDGGVPRLRFVECKASRRDRTYHRVQVAIYRMMLRGLLATDPVTVGGAPLSPDRIECVVARVDEETNRSQEILSLTPLALDMEDADVARILAPDGELLRLYHAPLKDLGYQLDAKCDGCVFNVHCLPESGRQRRLELLGIEPSTVRILQTAGVRTIDELADLDLTGPAAAAVRENPGFTDLLPALCRQAQARRRTLPGGDAHADEHEVIPLPFAGQGQLPEHQMGGKRLVRVYLSVHYDYAENRAGALAAHVTTSERPLSADFVRDGTGWKPEPGVKERWVTGTDATGAKTFAERPLQGREVIVFKSSEWTGSYLEDTAAEREMIQQFLHELVGAIAEVAESPAAPIHFYVWSRAEMRQLVEACSRSSSRLLGHLRELLGCRESLEQLIFSCLQDEVCQRFALGWTGRGLAVAASLRWFGRRYHWVRRISGEVVDLEKAFTQDIFDFKTTLRMHPDGTWADPDDAGAKPHKFEIRSRFGDTLTAPYWRAYWRTLPDPADKTIDPRVRGAIQRYNTARKPNHLKEYLRARVHAMRWIEENVRFKNPEIVKPDLVIADLPDFTLGVTGVAQAAVDFLRLDHHVQRTDWIAAHLVPPAGRVAVGRTIPLADVTSLGGNRITARIDLTGYDIDLPTLEARCTIAVDSFVRLAPCADDPHRGQTLGQLTRGGKTCRVTGLDWASGTVTLEAMWTGGSTYTLFSTGATDPGEVYPRATLDESPSDFVAGRVEARLLAGLGRHVYGWLDPEAPAIPPQTAPPPDRMAAYETFLAGLRLPPGDRPLAAEQAAAVLAGLRARVQLLQGPPGTGKTTTTSVAVLNRVLARLHAGDIVLVAAHTHTAVDTLLRRIDAIRAAYGTQARAAALTMPAIRLSKVHSSADFDPTGGGIADFVFKPSIKRVNELRSGAVLVIGGTTSAILKLAEELGERQPYSKLPGRFQAPSLIVDEASMMVFPHFLALATLVEPGGEIMLAGDHRQLSPIVAHDWEDEDRPPVVLYQPFASAYDAVLGIKEHGGVPDESLFRGALHFTFRLPPVIRDLIARLYRLDDIELEGLDRPDPPPSFDGVASWQHAWQGATGLYLVTHSERASKRSNDTEARILRALMDAAPPQPDGSVAVITPHRAQRSLLRTALAAHAAAVDVIDTVERLQGGERPTIIVSATVSDPAAIANSVEFILNLNRSNVAFSRTQNRLIVVCSDSLLDHIPVEVEHYESAMLWKSLRSICSRQIAAETVGGHAVRVYTPPLAPPAGAGVP